MKKVVKFGGSSLANAKQFKKVADIIKADKSRRYVFRLHQASAMTKTKK